MLERNMRTWVLENVFFLSVVEFHRPLSIQIIACNSSEFKLNLFALRVTGNLVENSLNIDSRLEAQD